MRGKWFVLVVALLAAAPSYAGNGIVSVKSASGAKETADRIAALAQKRGMTLFARIDHAEGAKKAGMDLRPTEVLIFGNPKGGTPLMQCAQTVGIDLPLKMLVHEDKDGAVWISYNDPEYLKERHRIVRCRPVLQKIEGFLRKLAGDAAKPGS